MDAGFGIEFMFPLRPTLGLHPPRKDFPAEGFRGVLGKLWGGTRQETGRSEHSMVLALLVVAIVTPFSSGLFRQPIGRGQNGRSIASSRIERLDDSLVSAGFGPRKKRRDGPRSAGRRIRRAQKVVIGPRKLSDQQSMANL
jgi:hypothetical protein